MLGGARVESYGGTEASHRKTFRTKLDTGKSLTPVEGKAQHGLKVRKNPSLGRQGKIIKYKDLHFSLTCRLLGFDHCRFSTG